MPNQLSATPAEQPSQVASIGNDKQFVALMNNWLGAAHSCDSLTRTVGAKHAWFALIAHIDAWGARRAAVPDGWQLVPVEPTDEMMHSGDVHMDGVAQLGDAWASMLAAAPSPHNNQQDNA